MKAWDSIAGDFEQDKREPKAGEYHLEWKRGGEVVGLVTCYVPGITMIDFYRTPLHNSVNTI